MARYTKFDNVEVAGKFKAADLENLGLTESTYKITSADATAAAGDAPTKAEYDAVVTLVNELKTDYNKLVKALSK